MSGKSGGGGGGMRGGRNDSVFASEQSRYITGQMISIDGGMSAHVMLDTGD